MIHDTSNLAFRTHGNAVFLVAQGDMDEAANNSADSQLEAEADLERAAHAYRTASEIWRLKHELIVGIMNLSSRFLVMRRRECSHVRFHWIFDQGGNGYG